MVTFKVRYQATIFLSRLDCGRVEDHLHSLLEQPDEAGEWVGGVEDRHLRLRLLLARLRTRGQAAQARVEALAAVVGRRLEDLTPNSWRQMIPGPSPESVIRREVFELLYSVAQAGEDILPLRSRLRLGGEYGLLLNSASLGLEEEITSLLDHMEKQDSGSPPFLSNNFLPNRGPRALTLLLERLQAMAEHPERHFRLLPVTARDIHRAEEAEQLAAKIGTDRDLSHFRRPRYAGGYRDLFFAATCSDDARFLPVLKQLEEKFQADPDTEVRGNAESARWALQQRLQLLQAPPQEGERQPRVHLNLG